MSNKLTLEGLQAFKNKIDAKFSLKGHTHSDYATKTELANAGAVQSVNGQTGAVSISVPTITSGTTDLEAGTSPLATGAIYLVYEEEE